jgi:hypothetical protein
MLANSAVPGFGTKLRTECYYRNVDDIIRTLRPFATLRLISEKLNASGFTTPRNMPWDRQRLAAYMRKKSF